MSITMNAPGTANNPWTPPAGIICPVGGLKTSATLGIGGLYGVGGYSCFVHDATYGTLIDSQVSIGTLNYNDWVWAGAVVRTGANAGAMVGVGMQGSGDMRIGRVAPNGTFTQVGSNQSVDAFTSPDDLRCTYNTANGEIKAYYKGVLIVTETDTTYAAESTLAAGGGFSWTDSGASYITQFVGVGDSSAVTGTMAATESGADTFAATGTTGSNGIRLTLRDTDTGALAASLTGLIVSIRATSQASALLIAAVTNETTTAGGILEVASGSLGTIGTYVYVTVEKSDNTIVACYRVAVIDLNA